MRLQASPITAEVSSLVVHHLAHRQRQQHCQIKYPFKIISLYLAFISLREPEVKRRRQGNGHTDETSFGIWIHFGATRPTLPRPLLCSQAASPNPASELTFFFFFLWKQDVINIEKVAAFYSRNPYFFNCRSSVISVLSHSYLGKQHRYTIISRFTKPIHWVRVNAG